MAALPCGRCRQPRLRAEAAARTRSDPRGRPSAGHGRSGRLGSRRPARRRGRRLARRTRRSRAGGDRGGGARKQHGPSRTAAANVQAAQQAALVAGSRMLPWVGANIGGNVVHDDSGSTNESSVAYLGVAWEADVWGQARGLVVRPRRPRRNRPNSTTHMRASHWLRSAARLWYLNTEANQLVALGEQAVDCLPEADRPGSDPRRLRQGVEPRPRVHALEARVGKERPRVGAGGPRRSTAWSRGPAGPLPGGRDPAPPQQFPPLPPPPAARRAEFAVAAQAGPARVRTTGAGGIPQAGVRRARRCCRASRCRYPVAVSASSCMTLLDLNPWLAAAGIGMSVPIYEGGRLQAQVEIATAEQAAAVAGYGSAVLGAFREVESTVANDSIYAVRLPLEQRALADRKETVRISRIQYTAGKIDLLWVGRAAGRRNQQRAEPDQDRHRAAREPHPDVSRARQQLRCGPCRAGRVDRPLARRPALRHSRSRAARVLRRELARPCCTTARPARRRA